MSFSSSIEGRCHSGYLVGAMDTQVCAFREVLPQQPVGVLVSAALLSALRLAEVDLDIRIDIEAIVLSQFDSLIPSQRATQVFGQSDDGARDRVAHASAPFSGPPRPVLHARNFAMLASRGRCNSIVKPVVRSTTVPIAPGKTEGEVSLPMSRLDRQQQGAH